ncbi:MAG: MBL fold metallo-hydrolase [Myxococcales bacterium]|nr:MBL fold metallo-hydrolase [Myxococcales bacterium]
MPAQLTIAGAAGGVTGSCYHLAHEGVALVIDCGTFQGGREAETLNRRPWPFDPAKVDALLLTHGHLDHAGRVPLLVDDGFSGPIHGTPATLEIASMIMEDTVKIAAHADGPPLYGKAALGAARERLRPLRGYRAPITIGPFTVEAFDAGHILGSSHLRIAWRDGGAERAILFSGDIGVIGTPIIRDPTSTWDPALAVDYVVTESTYGDRAHPDRVEAKATFRDVVRRALTDGGKVLIPAFAIGRTQEILYELNTMIEAGEVGPVPVIIDGPLSATATQLYARYRGLYDEDAAAALARGDHPLELESLLVTRDGRAAIKAIDHDGPAIIIAGSGMCNGGRIRGHLARYLPDARTDVLLVGYQGARTLGRALEDGAREVWLDGGQVPVRGRITRLSGYSAHADRDGLAAWFGAVPRAGAATAIVTHGEDDARASYAALLRDRFGAATVVPDLDQTIALA